ncbi:helix-turn-helix domain-containing protein [Candidatus Marinarcus aquaticus]|uniref:Transcriptional regulator n=1 Tax=Candidatus Marinarcus aquaticus TaxID=2044504 RepID=A0A4V1LNY6_9BACT|nr:AraC family transcriptional regulator [Candidatus Marinarcus aquaticus]RXJ57650.1 transcriptional regulator [Candidatus Marinarcus aquaticus]
MCKVQLKDLLLPTFNSNKNIIKNSFPKEIGNDYMEKIDIQEGFIFLKTKYNFKRPTLMEAKQSERKLVITISLKGNVLYKSMDCSQKLNFQEGFTTISLLNSEIEGLREFQDHKIDQVRIILDENFLKRNLKENILEKYFNEDSLSLINFRPTSLYSELLVNDILHCNLQGDIHSLYTQAKALELLSIELGKLYQNNSDTMLLNQYDKEAIYQAKKLLLSNFQNPPSICELAKKVHLNEFKLKKGFKQIFHTTPYKLLAQYKLNKAKRMLESGDYNINEVAQYVGFKYANNFSNAFFKEFGILPKEVMKNIKYY